MIRVEPPPFPPINLSNHPFGKLLQMEAIFSMFGLGVQIVTWALVSADINRRDTLQVTFASLGVLFGLIMCIPIIRRARLKELTEETLRPYMPVPPQGSPSNSPYFPRYLITFVGFVLACTIYVCVFNIRERRKSTHFWVFSIFAVVIYSYIWLTETSHIKKLKEIAAEASVDHQQRVNRALRDNDERRANADFNQGNQEGRQPNAPSPSSSQYPGHPAAGMAGQHAQVPPNYIPNYGPNYTHQPSPNNVSYNPYAAPMYSHPAPIGQGSMAPGVAPGAFSSYAPNNAPSYAQQAPVHYPYQPPYAASGQPIHPTAAAAAGGATGAYIPPQQSPGYSGPVKNHELPPSYSESQF